MILLGNDTPASTVGDHHSLLRQEIIDSQKTQADFLKWKLISVASVASISFGFSSFSKEAPDSAKLLICLVPLLCVYVDLISLHIMIRIITIGSYLRMHGNTYEEYVFIVRDRSGANPFVFEAMALHGSSILFNLILIALRVILPKGPERWPANAYMVAGALGIAATLTLWKIYVTRAKEVMRLAEQFKPAREPATFPSP